MWLDKTGMVFHVVQVLFKALNVDTELNSSNIVIRRGTRRRIKDLG